MKKAFITGITGQDGSYLSELLLDKGYEVHGLVRRSSNFVTCKDSGIIYENGIGNLKNHDRLHLHYGDLSDFSSISRCLEEIRPDEIYNLGAMSDVRISFDTAEYTANISGLGALRVVEALRNTNLKKTKFYQASSSEMFGKVQEVPQNEVRMPSVRFLHTGYARIIVSRTVCLFQLVFYLTMNHRVED